MNFDIRFLNLPEAAEYIGRKPRWMRRHWIDLVNKGVSAYRIPKGSPRGHLMFSKSSLDRWLENCRIKTGEAVRYSLRDGEDRSIIQQS